MTEDTDKTTAQIVKNFFSEVLQIRNVKVNSSQRLGSQPEMDSSFNRPILVKFGNWVDRNLIWKKRFDIPDNDDRKIRIPADLLKDLREGIPTLYKVANAASKIKEFANAKVHDYQLEINGKTFQISNLEQLPKQNRPSTLAELKSDTHLVFFSWHSRFSNHDPSVLTIEGQQFESMEHFLATRRAELSGKEDLIKKAQEAQDPVKAKHILNAFTKRSPARMGPTNRNNLGRAQSQVFAESSPTGSSLQHSQSDLGRGLNKHKMGHRHGHQQQRGTGPFQMVRRWESAGQIADETERRSPQKEEKGKTIRLPNSLRDLTY